MVTSSNPLGKGVTYQTVKREVVVMEIAYIVSITIVAVIAIIAIRSIKK